MKKITERVQKEVKEPKQQRSPKQKKQVIQELAEEEILVILYELAEENSEASHLLRNLQLRLEALRKFDRFRHI